MTSEGPHPLPLTAEVVRTLGLITAASAIGVVDYLSGPDYGFALFYLIPVIAAAWLVSRRSAVIVGVVSAMVWVTADITQLGVEHLAPSTWNGFTRLVIFVGAALLVSQWKRSRVELEHRASRAIDERETARRLAVIDPLTGLYNRNFLLEESARMHDGAWNGGNPYSVIAMDVDNLKRLNDTSGHSEGDRALRRMAELIRSRVRRADLPIRTGGDEFLILLPDASEDEAADIAARIMAGDPGPTGSSAPASFSTGVATWRGHGTFEEVLAEADRRMYEAKGSRHHLVTGRTRRPRRPKAPKPAASHS